MPDHGQTFVRDDQFTGFALRVTANGIKSFVWEGRIHGRTRRITLGQFPTLSVLEARNAAFATKTAIVRGEDPAQESADLRAQVTLGQLADAYIERHAKPRKRSWREDDALIKNHIPQAWRHRRVCDISRADIIELRDTVARKRNPRKKGKAAAEGIPYASNHLVRLLRAMFNLARDWGMLNSDNPATRIKLMPERKRDRFLSPDELGRVNRALAEEPNQYWRAYFALSLTLGTRKGELLGLRWTDIDFRQRTLRIPRTKAGRPHLLPLPSPTVSILESLPSRNTSEWVFPSTASSTGHLVNPKVAWGRIRKAAKIPDVLIHDLRRTLGSWLAASGYSLPLIGRALNHTNVSTTAIYARLNLDPVRQALEQNATLMLSARPEEPQENDNHAAEANSDSPGTIQDPSEFLTKLPNGWIQLTREELYKRVWSRPILSVARDFGISDRGLGKICRRFEIPVPPRGYWAKRAAGIRLEKAPLPLHQSKPPLKIQIRPSLCQQPNPITPSQRSEPIHDMLLDKGS